MLHWLSGVMEEAGGPALFRFITSRAIFAVLTAFLFTLVFGRPLILRLYRAGLRTTERAYGDMNTQAKTGTPVMGGLILLAATLGSALLWCDLGSRFVQAMLVASVWFAGMGARDDLLKVRHRDADRGLSRAAKYAGQIAFGLALGLLVVHPRATPLPAALAGELHVPFYKHAVLDLGWAYAAFVVLMIVYAANSVNLTDGLDGLAIVPSFFVVVVLGVFAYVVGNRILADHFLYPYLPGAGELTVFAACLGGAALGFLWFNAFPAEVFMGDTGSLFLGGVAGTMAVLLKQEVLFLIAGGVFVVVTASSFLQEKIGLGLLGRRLFTRAPIHHALQHRGMAESKVTVRFWIVSAILAAFALATLKVR